MMKIHTTQDLNSLVQLNQLSTNNVSSKDFRLKNYSEQVLMPKLSAERADFYSSISFRANKPSVKDAKKIINMSKKAVGEIKKNANPEMKRGDKFLTGSFFNTLLNVSKYETVVQAAMAALICTVLRPITIMSLPSKKGKQDNTYASAHSIASGIVGLITTFALTTPFKMGADHVTRVMMKDLKKETLERLYPQLDLNSIIDKATGKRVDVKKWLNKDGKDFCKELKDVMKLPEFKQLADVSEQTFNKVLKVDADWASQKGKSFNDVVLKNGEKLYDKIDMDRIGIVVKEDGIRDAQILLKDIDKEYLNKIIKDAPKESDWNKLNIESVFDKNGEVADFRLWKDTNGKQWKLDLDTAYVSSPYETVDYRPRISGHKRYDKRDNEYKFTTYQKNGVDGKLGTAIDNGMVDSEARNEGHMKLLTWFPDLVFRIPIAATTIALIPWILKTVFGVEKSKKKKNAEVKQPQQQIVEKDIKAEDKEQTVDKNKEPNFKGAKDGKDKASWFVRKFGEWYGKPLLENKHVASVSEKLSKLPGNITQHMATLGSLITSSVYVQRTMTNKDLDSDRRRTLAINQALCFFIPTIAAYTVDHFIKDWTKKKEYRYSGWQEHFAEVAKYEGKILNNKDIQKELGSKLKGVRILSSLATFTLIYRYATPVIITPIANWIGDRINTKKRLAKEAELNTQDKAKEISLESNKSTKQVA